MSFPRLLIFFALILFGSIALAAWLKNHSVTENKTDQPITLEIPKEEAPSIVLPEPLTVSDPLPIITSQPARRPLPEADRIQEFFNKASPQFPIVETVIYHSRVPWLKGRPAWISDYASHYRTSKHFIARSLNGKPDYFKQEVSEGDRFTVLRPDKDIEFYLLVDVMRCKMWFYYLDKATQERVLVKSYDVGLGRVDSGSASGFLTPLGKYTLGSGTGTYRPQATGLYNGRKIEMMTVFGTRWIPFGEEIGLCTASPRGLGLHGSPWIRQPNGELAEDSSGLGKHLSDGCIRLATKDMEELYAIIVSRPGTIELVRDFYLAELPGVEKP